MDWPILKVSISCYLPTLAWGTGSDRGCRHYSELLSHSSPMELGEGLLILVLELGKLIELKRTADRPKDVAVLPVLEASLKLTLE